MGMLDDETVRMYVDESREHLANIENDLLAIENGGADIDSELVNKVFRAAHSLKGGAGFLNLTRIKELAHKMENVLDLIRSRELVPSPEIINILLLSFDRLRELINNIEESNDADISEFVLSLTALTAGSLPADQKESIEKVIDIKLPDGKTVLQIKDFDLAHARKGGNNIYLIEYDLIHDVQRRGKIPLAVLRNMMDAGQILDCIVNIAAVGTLDDEPSNKFPFYVLFATIIEPGIMEALLDIDHAQIHFMPEDKPANKPEISAPVEVPADTAIRDDAAASAPPLSPPADIKETGIKNKEPSITKDNSATAGETTLRVNVELLESLMNLAGELVLGRNQMMQAIAVNEYRSILAAGQKINVVTSELQEAIMLTRMQPIGNIFNKFPRVVRDLAKTMGREVDLNISGKEVEMDKTIIEGLSDPLVHLVRNAVDHGIETPDVRRKSGKKPSGTINLRAYNEAGQVNIEITDDGQGIDPEKITGAAIKRGIVTTEQLRTMSDREKMSLILLPGFSTAEKVTDISGRGVGMDVVKTNLDRLGGQIEIESVLGKGSTFRIKLPLTLAIIPCLFISVGGLRYAIPQANVEELIRISAMHVQDRIERIGSSEVLILRGTMIPVIHLADSLGIPRSYVDAEPDVRKPDRRQNITDRRSSVSPLFKDDLAERDTGYGRDTPEEERRKKERRYHATSDVSIVVVKVGNFSYGLVVDELHDSIEIVVKPLGRHLKHIREYAGATIMGNGRLALILDVNGIAAKAGLTSLAGTARAQELAEEAQRERFQDSQSILMFRNSAEESCAIPLDLVERVEQISMSDIERVAGRTVLQYRGVTMPLFSLSEVITSMKPITQEQGSCIVIVLAMTSSGVGLLGMTPVDVVETRIAVDRSTLKQKGVMGSAIINGQTTLILDIHELVETRYPEWFSGRKKVTSLSESGSYILLAEDSDFFRNQVKKFMEDEGYQVITAEDGLQAWDLLRDYGDKIKLVITDIEMPRLDGYGLTKSIRSHQQFNHLPVIALTSLAGEDDMAKGKAAGVNDYQIKMDKEKLLGSLYGFLQTGR